MKKLILLGLMMLLGLPLAAYSAPVEGPPAQGFNIGLGQDYTNYRDLKPHAVSISTNGTPIGCNIRHMYRTMLKVGYGFFDFLEVYIKLGGADYKFRGDIEDQFGNPEGVAKINTKWGFAYGAGLKGAYTFKNGLLVGADLQYLRHRQKYRARLTDLIGEDTSTGKVTLQEWQFGPFVGYKIMKFLPYVGVKYSDVRLKIRDCDGETTKLKADDHFGAFVGLTYDIMPQVKLNLEGRFIDETGVNFNVIFKF